MTARPTRLAIARLWHEGNSFSPVPTGIEAFEASEWTAGEAARAVYRGTRTEIGGALDFLDANPGWEATFLRMAAAIPGGPVPRALFEQVRAEILDGLSGGGFDAVYLSLHGALVVEGLPLADLELVRRVRAAIGRGVWLAASFDLHANMHPDLASLLDVATGYRTHPHVDMHETGRRALAMLKDAVEGRTRPARAPSPSWPPSCPASTCARPTARWRRWRRWRARRRDCRACWTSASSAASPTATRRRRAAAVMVFADGDRALAAREAARLVAEYEARRDRFFVSLPDVARGLDQALDGGALPRGDRGCGRQPLFGRHRRHAGIAARGAGAGAGRCRPSSPSTGIRRWCGARWRRASAARSKGRSARG